MKRYSELREGEKFYIVDDEKSLIDDPGEIKVFTSVEEIMKKLRAKTPNHSHKWDPEGG